MSAEARKPTLVLVSGPPASGKTTLAHALAQAIPCPAVCRDEIKEGMVHAHGAAFEAAPGDRLNARTLPVFFDDGYVPDLAAIRDFVNRLVITFLPEDRLWTSRHISMTVAATRH